MTLKGVDVSTYQGAIDWEAAKGAGFDFGVARCVRETLAVDDTFRRNLKGMRDAGLVAGAYVFLNTGHAIDQAKTLIAELKANGGPVGVLCVNDVERNADGSMPTRDHVINFAKTFKTAFPKQPLGVYGSNALSGLGDLTEFYDFLWVANYGTNPEGNWLDTYKARGGDSSPVWSDRRNGMLPSIWQFSSRGHVSWDSSARIDFNACKLTLAKLQELAGIVPVVTPPTTYTQAQVDAIRAAEFAAGKAAGIASVEALQDAALIAEFNKGVIAASSAALTAQKA